MNADEAVSWAVGFLSACGLLALILMPTYDSWRRERARRRALDERLRIVLTTDRESGPTIVGKRVKVMEGGPKAPLVPRYDDEEK